MMYSSFYSLPKGFSELINDEKRKIKISYNIILQVDVLS